MRALILGVVLSTMVHSAIAGEAVQLDGRKLTGQMATGTCGAASIKVFGIDGEWISPTGQVEVKGKTRIAAYRIRASHVHGRPERSRLRWVKSGAKDPVARLLRCQGLPTVELLRHRPHHRADRDDD